MRVPPRWEGNAYSKVDMTMNDAGWNAGWNARLLAQASMCPRYLGEILILYFFWARVCALNPFSEKSSGSRRNDWMKGYILMKIKLLPQTILDFPLCFHLYRTRRVFNYLNDNEIKSSFLLAIFRFYKLLMSNVFISVYEQCKSKRNSGGKG